MAEVDDDYANAPYIPNADAFPPRWEAEASAFRAGLSAVGRAELDLAYGAGARQRYDLFHPEGDAQGLAVFIHGGYWIKFDKSSWSHFAQGALARGWAVAMPSYTTAPDGRISQMTAEMAQAIDHAAAKIAGPIAVAGHSAGGHLTARMICRDAAPQAAERICRAVPISPLTDLRPMLPLSMNADWQMSEAEAALESPALNLDRLSADVTVWVGGAERPVFLDHANWLGAAWKVPVQVEPGIHHFNVIDPLCDPSSALMAAYLGP